MPCTWADCGHVEEVTNTFARHRRTHEARPDGEVSAYSDEDLEAEENEFGILDDESPPPPDHAYMSNGLTNGLTNGMANSPITNMTAVSMRMPTTGMGTGHAMAPPQMISTQHMLQQQM